MAHEPDPEYKAILVKNETSNSAIFLFVYATLDPICWLSLNKQTIEPGKQYFYRDRDAFKYEIRIKKKEPKKAKRTIVLPVQMWTEDKLISVKDGTDDNGIAHEEKLSKYPEERQIAIRRKNLEDETSWEYGRDLYGILKLNMKEVRKKKKEEQDEMIKKAYRKQMLLFHPDRNPELADSHICQEITMAYSILGDPKKRALYHDLTDYSGGWLSKSRWKAIFTPEAHGSNEKWKRIGLFVFSAALVAGGIAISICTAGLGIPAFFCGNAAAGALIGGAIQGAFRVASYDSIENGVKVKKYAQSFAIGAALGAAAGGACAGITSAILGIENTVAAIAEAGAGELVGSGAATGSVNGFLSSVSSDIDSIVVDGESKSLADVATHALRGAAIGSTIGIIFSGAAKVEAKFKELGKTKSETIKQNMLGMADCAEHLATPTVLNIIARYLLIVCCYSVRTSNGWCQCR